MESAFIVTAVAGATELIKRLRDRDYAASLIIVAAAAIGALAGVYHVDNLTVAQGIIAGLAAPGIVTIASKVG